ncbi:MAG: Gfo/Idh/MocA family oxidoreductase [Chloroflexi bacterium]|nr:Gfo/Idh/MocA family oxidoreductase [Chloroflexota bacterium]
MKRVGVIGMGKMGIVHASILNALPDVDLVAVTDTNKGLHRQIYSMGIQSPFYQSIEEMLVKENPDGVYICTPTSANYGIAKLCVAKGVSIFVEKPLAIDLPNATKMLELVEGTEIKHSIGFMVAQIPTFRRAKAMLVEGAIGQLQQVEAKVYLSAVFSKQRMWFCNKEKSGGGAIISLGSYLIFLLHWLFSPVRHVWDSNIFYTSGNEVEDGGNAKLELESGIMATMDVSWCIHGYENMLLEIRALGSEGELTVDNSIVQVHRSDGSVNRVHVSELPDKASFYLGGEGYCLEDEDFVSCIGTDIEPEVTWRDGYQVQKVLDAIYRSAEARQRVAVGIGER